MSKRKDDIEKAAGALENICHWNDYKEPFTQEPPDFRDCVSWIRALRGNLRVLSDHGLSQSIEDGVLGLRNEPDGHVGIYVNIGGFQEKA